MTGSRALKTDNSEVEKARLSPEARRIKAQLADREWRLDNLYWIKDEDGQTIRFRRNEAQRDYDLSKWSRDVIVKARRLGFSTFIGIAMLDRAIFQRGMRGAIIDVVLTQSKVKLAAILFAYNHLGDGLGEDADSASGEPGRSVLGEQIRQACWLKTENKETLEWSNGSGITVGTSYRGGGLQMLHVSEYGKISADTPDVAKEIKTGSMRSVPVTGWIAVESTAHGTAGEFYDVVKTAEAKATAKLPLSALDYKLHFYGWWIKPEHRLPNNLVLITHEMREYFAKVAPLLKARHGVVLDADQQAWYASQYADLGPDDVKEEFPTLVEETFFNSLEGAFWKAEIARARADQRIGLALPYDPTRLVNTFWDVGEDCTAIWFHQTDGVRHRFIDYWEMVGSSLQESIGVIEDKRRDRGFNYAKHFGPHDLDNKDWGNSSKTKAAMALEQGLKFTVVPRVLVKADSIEAARRMLSLSWFDAEHCDLGVQRLENYRKKWNKQLAAFTSEPEHKMPSHGSDAYQQGAMGFEPEKPKREGGNRRERKGSAWGA